MTEIKPDIICALATPPGKSALAIVRVSGPGSIAMTSSVIPALSNFKPDDARRLVYDFALDDNRNPIDEVTAIPYMPPKSYTAEEMVEVICHGGYAASQAIIRRLTSLGARIAEPGEFTRRAFLNGRISLSQAEAVAAAIEAKSELALKAAALNLKGELYNKIDTIRTAIADLLTLIEAEIDFSEEEIDKTPFDDIRSQIETQLARSDKILKGYDFGRGLNAGYKIAIVGRANVGKSSLLNALLRRDRAIVTDIPGTTRDTLTEWIEIDGFPVLLTDTAGLRRLDDPVEDPERSRGERSRREGSDMVEAIGMERTRGEIERSDLVLFMVDSSLPITDEDLAIFRGLADRPRLVVANKIDLPNADCGLRIAEWGGEDSELRPSTGSGPSAFPNDSLILISALTGAGLEALRTRIAHFLNLDTFSLDTALLATQRQYQAMQKAYDTLSQARDELKLKPSGEVLALYFRETLDHLGELVGETTTEDILNNIFVRFCVGK